MISIPSWSDFLPMTTNYSQPYSVRGSKLPICIFLQCPCTILTLLLWAKAPEDEELLPTAREIRSDCGSQRSFQVWNWGTTEWTRQMYRFPVKTLVIGHSHRSCLLNMSYRLCVCRNQSVQQNLLRHADPTESPNCPRFPLPIETSYRGFPS